MSATESCEHEVIFVSVQEKTAPFPSSFWAPVPLGRVRTTVRQQLLNCDFRSILIHSPARTTTTKSTQPQLSFKDLASSSGGAEGAGGRSAAQAGSGVFSIPGTTHHGLGGGTVLGCCPQLEGSRNISLGLALPVLFSSSCLRQVIVLGCLNVGGGQSMRRTAQRDGRVLDLCASKWNSAGINKGETSRDLEEQKRLSEKVLQPSPLNSVYHFREVIFRTAAGRSLRRIPCLTLNKLFADGALHEQRQIFRLPCNNLESPQKVPEMFSIFSQPSCFAVLQGRPRTFTIVSFAGIRELLSCSLVQWRSALKTLHTCLCQQQGSSVNQTNQNKLKKKRNFKRNLFFSVFFPNTQFLGAFCPTVKILHVSCYDSGGLKLVKLIQGNSLKN